MEKQKETINMPLKDKENLFLTITELEYEIFLLKDKVKSMIEFVLMMSNNLDILDDVLEENMKVVGFDYNSMNKKIKVLSMKKIEFQKVDHMPQHHARHVYPHHRGYKNSAKRCHHCGIYGHIRPKEEKE